MDATEMLELFNDFFEEEHPEIVSTPIVKTKVAAATDNDNQEESVSRGNQDSDDEGWEEGYIVGDAVEKDSVDDDQTSCTSFDAAPGTSGITPTSARGSNRYQKRQKEELKYLQSRVRELEDELRRVNEDNHTKLGNSMWQRVAQQQSVARQQSASDCGKS